MTSTDLSHDPYVAAFPELAPFWQAAAGGALLLPYCQDCGRTHWHPRAFCPECGSDRLRWQPAAGTATLHTFSAIHRGQAPVYVLAYVQLDEGPLAMTNIVGADAADLYIGMRLRVAFRQTPEGRHAPVFEPM
ncbi:Zn-ribbon domain-containing OB-fold protein [Bordetella genomosp. 6]|uniref:DNA-binding protein n=1 Tax=Bordetella genomosp. 6 TaxID=463024 RepID=A0ABX4F765_9BORD|nr:OB-fold domain-containing protein [Bordetella genomosp. 6]ARP78556.1 hypothetical protein CAL11_21530 [Bordetella genomosp. 6]MBN3267898.1 hypothetical protein [Bordetella bronchiseptica]OZI70078.1 hypothetical protein CAL23_21075 [Bordetella genomosp. 6]